METKKYITINDLAERYGVHPSFFRKRIKDGTLKAFRIGGVLKATRGKDGIDREIMRGGTWRVDEADVDRFFAEITVASTADRKDDIRADVRTADRKDVPTADLCTEDDFIERIRPYRGGYINDVAGVDEAIRAGILVDINTASAVAGVSTSTVKTWMYADLIDVFYTSETGRKAYFIRSECNVQKVESNAPVIEAVPMNNDIKKQLEDGTVVAVDKLASEYVVKARNVELLCKYGRLKSFRIQGAPSYLVDLNAFRAFALKKNIKPRTKGIGINV